MHETNETNNRPEWIDNTPEGSVTEYELALVQDGEFTQEISVNRNEYIELKAHLAALRGHEPTKDERFKLTAEVLGQLSDLDREFMDACFKARSESTGVSSPAEEFVTSIVTDYQVGRLNPRTAKRELAEFEDNFERAIRAAKKMIRDFPVLFPQEEPDAEAMVARCLYVDSIIGTMMKRRAKESQAATQGSVD